MFYLFIYYERVELVECSFKLNFIHITYLHISAALRYPMDNFEENSIQPYSNNVLWV